VKGLKTHWISGMPRSGSTWLSQLFFSSQEVKLKFCPLFSYEFKNQLDEKAGCAEWQAFFDQVYLTESEFLDQEYLRKQGLVPKFKTRDENPMNLVIKSTRFQHLLPFLMREHRSVKIIHIVRHPCASIYSWLSNPFELPNDVSPMDNWRTGECRKTSVGEFWGFDDWKHVNTQAISLEKQYPERFKIVQYENLATNPECVIKDIFKFCDITFSNQTQDFIYSSQNTHDANKRSVYKNADKEESWMENLAPEIIDVILKETENTALHRFLATKSDY
jgi:hypothetical protein